MRVLFVDDEPRVLDGIRRQFRRRADVHVATSAEQGLELLEHVGPFALIISDMRMPGMNGAEFLGRVRERHPDTVRMVLSGQSDLDSAIAAVNDGRIFRFLTKPCSGEALESAVAAGLDQYRLVTAERELLDQTLHGLVETLTDILGLANPVARRRTARVRQYATAIAHSLGMSLDWQLRLATMLSQLGCITLPAEILDKLHSGESLNDPEKALYRRHPELAAQLVSRIPRLEGVADLIGRQLEPVDFSTLPEDIGAWDQATAGRVVLAMATMLDEWLTAGDQPAAAIARLEQAVPGLPAPVLRAVRAVHVHSAYMDIRLVGLPELVPGMVLDEDVLSPQGETLLARGEEITTGLLQELQQNPERHSVAQKLRVLVPA